jgi:calcineurin-like phosphoesterase family protein
MSVFFTSDTHFNHKKIIEYCPDTRGQFLLGDNSYDLDGMNSAIVEMWNSTVKENDLVYFLGDWSLNHNVRNKFIKLLNGWIIWIRGNHDHKCEDSLVWRKNLIYEKAPRNLPNHRFVILNGHRYWMVHSPFDSQKLTEIQKGDRIVCGHVHEKWKVKPVGDWVPSYNTVEHQEAGFKTNNPIINVGLDAWDFKMVTLEELEMAFERIE